MNNDDVVRWNCNKKPLSVPPACLSSTAAAAASATATTAATVPSSKTMLLPAAAAAAGYCNGNSNNNKANSINCDSTSKFYYYNNANTNKTTNSKRNNLVINYSGSSSSSNSTNISPATNSLLLQPRHDSAAISVRARQHNQQVTAAAHVLTQRCKPLTSGSSRSKLWPQQALHCLSFVLAFLLCNFNQFGLTLATLAPANVNQTAARFDGSSNSLFSSSSNVEQPLPYFLDYEAGEPQAAGHYTHTWAVHIPNGDVDQLAHRVASEHGFVNLGKIFDDHYHFAHHRVSKRSLSPADEHQDRLDQDARVNWSKQQTAKSRQKRDFIRMRPSRTSRKLRAPSLVDAMQFTDPKWAQMWYLNRGGGLDMNVIPAWKEGITGKGIVVTILDDGLESDHPDIEHNYDPKASYDVNSHDNDPMPHYDMSDSNRHGTRCAGEVAATANNSICAVGIAYGASVGGVRMLDGDVTDAVEARSLSLNPQHIDIYSASWGPDDDGKTVDGPGELASRAFIEGVNKGRNGKGSIFIWASGNGGRELDNCNCDGYTNSIWTLSISSATEEGHVPWYSEKCSSTLATTYSSGGLTERQVVTTDLHHACTTSHTGTSASAPLAAGIAALVLEANQNLTWRDLQHIVVRTAKPANLKDSTWSKNGVGRRISHSFGYGLMDAAAMVKAARTWKTVPEQQRCEINAPHVDKSIPSKSYITLQLSVKHCLSVNYLEHVQAKITLTSQRRGDIQLYLKSPAGTKVTLLTSRQHDVSRSGFTQWPFMSVHTWGESPHGNWQLEIHNEGRYKAQITQWEMIFYGTKEPAQPNDPPQTELNSNTFNSLDNNDIEYDPTGQWKMAQVGENNLMSIDKTNSACLKTTIDQRCLVCAPPTYIFKAHCYEMCPPQTYAIMNNRTAANADSELVDNVIVPSTDAEEQLQSMDRKRRQYPKELEQNIRACAACDSSCLQCDGPLGSQCTKCFAGYQLRRQMFNNESYCFSLTERSSEDNLNEPINRIYSTKHVRFNTLIYYVVPFSVAAVLAIMIAVIYKYKCREDDSGEYTYDRVSLVMPEEEDFNESMHEQQQGIARQNTANEFDIDSE